MTTTIALTSQDFIAFINAQPESLEIDHQYWHLCASGDYIKSLGGISTTEVCHPYQYSSQYLRSTMIPENYEAIEDASKALTRNIQLVIQFNGDSSLYTVLEKQSRARKITPTYGALQKLIIDCNIYDTDKVVEMDVPR